MSREYDELMDAVAENGGVPCEINPDAFFPEDAVTQAAEAEQRRIAKKLCSDCPVKMQCLAYALADNVAFGIWGGTTIYQRREIRNRQRKELRKSWK